MANRVVVPRRVVIAMDGSDYSLRAFDWYIKNLHTTNDEYEAVLAYCPEYGILLHSHFLPNETGWITEKLKREEENIERTLNTLKQKLRDTGVRGRVVRLSGSNPGDAVIKLAEKENAECIVTGTRGHGKLRRTLMGSVSQYIVNHSQIPVFVCREKVKK